MTIRFEINTHEIDKIKVNRDDTSRIENKEDSAKTIMGVYKLINAEGVIVYVGLSKDVMKRIEQHKKEGKIIFDAFTFIECEESERELIEITLIHFYNPLYNKHHKKKD